MYKFKNIRIEHKKGKNYSQIGRDLDINRKTVRKYIQSNTPPTYSQRHLPTKEDLFEPFKVQVLEKLELVPEWGGSEVYEWIKSKGYEGSERTVFRRLKIIRDMSPKERFFEQNYLPGEQAQFDFKEFFEVNFSNGPMIVHLLFGTLPYSNKCSVKAFPNKNFECFIEGVHSFFEKIDGMTSIVRIDNLSPCVKKVLPNGKRLYTDSFNKAIDYYDFEVSPCSPGKGNEKGDVERDIRTYSKRLKNFIKIEGFIFRDFEHLNEVLENYLYQFTDISLYQEEVKKLLPVPDRDPLILCRVVEQKASSFGTVRISKEIYSIPDEVIGLDCQVIGGPYKVQVIQKNTKSVVAEHPRVSEGQKSILINHVIKSLIRKPGAMVRWDHKETLFPSDEFTKFYQALKKSEEQMNPEKEYLMCLNLIQNTTLKEIEVGMNLILETKGKVSFEELRALILGDRRPTKVTEISTQFGQEPLKPNLVDYDFLIPNEEKWTGILPGVGNFPTP